MITENSSLTEIFSKVRCCDCKLFNRCHQKGTEPQRKDWIDCDAYQSNEVV